MNNNTMDINKEIRSLSNYRALLLSKYYISVLLLIVSIYLVIKKYPASSFYILIILYTFPAILNFALSDYAKKYKSKLLLRITKDIPFILQSLKNKYKYTQLNYISNSITYLLCMLLLFLWQISYSKSSEGLLSLVPYIIIVSGIAVRIIFLIIYHFKLTHHVKHNRI